MLVALSVLLLVPDQAQPQGVQPSWKQSLVALHPKATPARVQVRSTASVKAQQTFPGSPYTIEGLLARRALNPARFDFYHPELGKFLARDEQLRMACAMGIPALNGLIAPTAYHRYLEFRRSLNPARFDFYHPILGVILAEDERLRMTPCPPMPTIRMPGPGRILPPPVGVVGGVTIPGRRPPGVGGGVNNHGGPPPPTGGPPPPPTVTQIAVPEPASVVLFCLGAAGLLGPALARRFRG